MGPIVVNHFATFLHFDELLETEAPLGILQHLVWLDFRASYWVRKDLVYHFLLCLGILAIELFKGL